MVKEDKKEMILDYLNYIRDEFHFDEFSDEFDDYSIEDEYKNFDINEIHGIAYTTDETGEHEMQVDIDFKTNKIIYMVDLEIIHTEDYKLNMLSQLTFGDFTSFVSDLSNLCF